MASGDLLVNSQRGFTYLAVLLGTALIGVGLSITATVWSKEAERQHKAEAEWALNQYERALISYYNTAPGSVKTLPNSLDELLQDKRHLGVIRHLRRFHKIGCLTGGEAQIYYAHSTSFARIYLYCPRAKNIAAREFFIDPGI